MRVTWRYLAAAAAVSPAAVIAASALAQQNPDFTGVWSGTVTSPDDTYWTVQDHLCFLGCPKVFHDTLGDAIADPANAEAPLGALIAAAKGAMAAEREAISTPEGKARMEAVMDVEAVPLESYCEPYGFVREATNALPMRIRKDGGDLVIDYEEFSLSRTIHMGAEEAPAEQPPTRFGWSHGRIEGDTLVVETVNIASDKFSSLVSPTNYWGSFADGATAVERYTLKESPRRLELELTLTDPVTLERPYVWTKTWLAAPDLVLVEDSCTDVPGQMEEFGES